VPSERAPARRVSALAGSPTADSPVTFRYDDLLGMPARSVVPFIECAGNSRSFFTTQQNQTVPGTPWLLGAMESPNGEGSGCPPCWSGPG
jgi:DMSO/TMAO reductase YedYZ molybdopterin-dependent catalytic subunit